MDNCENCIHSVVCKNYEPKSYSCCVYYKNKSDVVDAVHCTDCDLHGHCKIENIFDMLGMSDRQKLCSLGRIP